MELRGAYFLFVDISRIQLPNDYKYPEYVQSRSRDFKITYYMINEIGVSSIPGSCELHHPFVNFARIWRESLRLINCKRARLLSSRTCTLGSY